MKHSLLVLLLALTTNSVFACLSASQNRLFPLGQTSKGLCVVETHLYRTEFREPGKEVIELKPAWGGISYFKIYDKNYQEVFSEVIDTISLFEQHHYDSIINVSFRRGLRFAKKYPDFVAAKPISITFCDYQKTCSRAGILYDTINNKISIQLANKKTYEVSVLFDSTSIALNLQNYFGGFDDAALSVRSFKGSLYVNSVRQFQIGNRKLTVVHIGCGHKPELIGGETYPPGKEREANFPFAELNESVFQEPVLHHGHGFDFYVWE